MSLLLLLYHAVSITKSRAHSTDVNKKKAGNLVSHTTDISKSVRFSRTHTTDTYKVRKPIISHTTDVYKTVGSTVSTPAFVSSTSYNGSFGTPTGTLSVTAGNALIVIYSKSSGASIAAPTDTQGNTYSLLATYGNQTIYGAIAASTGSNVVSSVITSGNLNVIYSQYSGTSLTQDITAINATGSNSVPTSSGTTVTDNDLVISTVSATNSYSATVGTGYSNFQSQTTQSAVPIYAEDLVKTTAGGITPNFAGSSFFQWYILAIALKPGSTTATRTFAQRHTTDVWKSGRGTKTHTTDTYKRISYTRSHTTDVYLRYRSNYTRQNNATLPTTNTDLTTPFTNADYVTVAGDDSTYVSQTGANFNIFEFKWTHTNNNQAVTATWNGQSTTAPSSQQVVLQIWNYNSSAWETLQSNSVAAANTDFTLTGTKSSPANYYDGNNIVIARVYQ